MSDHEEEIDRLYGLPLDEFTAARDELARSLRAAGDREAATRVKQLRKPNLVGWALNRARRREPQRVDELIAAGERLQDAQRRLVAGGERGLLREAAVDQRRLVEELVGIGERELSEGGHPIGPTVQSKLWATVHAAAAGSEAKDLLRAGRLLRDYEISDLGLPTTGDVSSPSATPSVRRSPPAGHRPAQDRPVQDRPGQDRSAQDRPARPGQRGAVQRERRETERRLERASAQLLEHQEKLREAQQEAATARREAERAAGALRRAEAKMERTRAKRDEVRARMAELEDSLQALD